MESVVYYTLGSAQPTSKSKKYTGPFQSEEKLEISAIAYEPATGKSSPVSREKFDISRKNWKVIAQNDEKANLILDGNPFTAWHQNKNKEMPIDLVLYLGSEQKLCGFKYLPDQGNTSGAIAKYQFFVSQDNKEWKLVDEGEFANIKNNPLWQTKSFTAVKARYIKLRAVREVNGNNDAGYAEVDVITQ